MPKVTKVPNTVPARCRPLETHLFVSRMHDEAVFDIRFNDLLVQLNTLSKWDPTAIGYRLYAAGTLVLVFLVRWVPAKTSIAFAT